MTAKGLVLSLMVGLGPTAALAADSVEQLADAYVDAKLAYDPLSGLAGGLSDPSKISLPDRSPAAIAAFTAQGDQIASRLAAIAVPAPGSPSATTYAILKETLAADTGLRVCRRELWAVSHLLGWQVGLAGLADIQPVASAEQRARAKSVWEDLPRFLEVETANLRQGLASGYSVPRPVVERVLGQLDAALAAPPEKSPFYSPGRRANDPAYAAEMRRVVTEVANPAVGRYRDFLRDEYLPKARTTLGLSALPDGAACYQAQLRAFTTLSRTPLQVFELGRQTVAANVVAVERVGREKLSTADFAATVRKTAQAADNRFASEAELLSFAEGAVARGERRTAAAFLAPPPQAIVVQPLRDFQRGSGTPSHYQPSSDLSQPAVYRSASEQWATATRGDIEVTAVHEAVPGHHTQSLAARAGAPPSRLARLAANPAFIEGWARYAEALADEAGAYETPYALVTRRAWPARGLVVDPGLHALGWSRQQAVDYIMESGRFTAPEAEALVDRSAAMPGQLIAYDTGGLEIAALRHEAETRLGARFDLRQFHARVLEGGAVPLTLLRARIEAWIAGAKPSAGAAQ